MRKTPKKLDSDNKLISTIKDYQQVFATKAGERVLDDLIYFSGYLEDGIAKSEYEAGIVGGQRSVINRILRQLKTNPQKLLARMQEMEERKNHA